jgi:hypothetical protein
MPTVAIQNQPIPTGNVGIIQNFFSAAIPLLFGHSPTHPALNSQVRVIYGTVGPHTRWGGNPVAGYDVDLPAQDDLWDQHLYQFAHEACHVLAQFQNGKHCNLWFEESVCETASLYALRVLSGMGSKGRGPAVNLFCGPTPYHVTMQTYLDKHMAAPQRQLGSRSLRDLVTQELIVMRTDPWNAGRLPTQIIGKELLPLFIETPANWAAIEFLNTIPCSIGRDSFTDYLANWKKAAGRDHRSFIRTIERMVLRPKLCRLVAACLAKMDFFSDRK